MGTEATQLERVGDVRVGDTWRRDASFPQGVELFAVDCGRMEFGLEARKVGCLSAPGLVVLRSRFHQFNVRVEGGRVVEIKRYLLAAYP